MMFLRKESFLGKSLLLILSLALVFSIGIIAGCGSDDDDDDTPPSPPPAPAFQGNVFLDSVLDATDTADGSAKVGKNYLYFHGSTSPDKTEILITANEADNPMGVPNGVTHLLILDAAEMEKGNVVLKRQDYVQGDQSGPWGTSVNFRSNYTVDGSKILLSGADRFWVIDAETLTPLNGANGDILAAGENHDAMGTSDNKYAVLTVRTKPHATPNDGNMDGELLLYDLTANQFVGNSVSVCNACHNNPARSSVLCGIDGTIDLQTDGTYAGTVYVAGHGGHFAKVAITIDPANTTDPITADVSNFGDAYLQVSSLKHTNGQSQYMLHDGRLDGNTLYWSTYKTDENGRVHYGKIDLTTGAVTDVAVDVDVKAEAPDQGINVGPIYCASGQTATAFLPITMTNEAYITVIPKASIK